MTDLGVYAGPATKGVQAAQDFAAATGCPITYRVDFLPYATRAGCKGGIRYALDAHEAGPAMGLDLAVPLLTAEDRKAGVTLADVAAGALDDVWTEVAAQFAAHTRDRIMVRLGHEPNGNWYPWSTCYSTVEDSVAAWRHVVQLVRATPGTGHVTWTWCVANGRTSVCPRPDLSYPGGDVVDTIGVDVYDYRWRYARDGQGGDVRDLVWAELFAGDPVTSDYAVDYWRRFARDREVAFAVPEWGVAVKADGSAGGDSPDFVHRMLSWFDEAEVERAAYFEARGNGVDHRIATPDTLMPEAARAFTARMSARTLTLPATARRPAGTDS